jgi:SSS family solute:Na+ symporter
MNMHFVDWAVVASFLICLVAVVIVARRHTNSVADFLVANRCAGRYLLCISGGASAVGAISFVAAFEMYYSAGFTADWWAMLVWPIGLFSGLSGFVIYRYRETRAMTMGQFFEIRYSKPFRVYCGAIAWLTGVINMGIFPAVTARFFINFCGLPGHFNLLGFNCSTFALLMFVELSMALTIIFLGGMVVIALADFLQGLFNSLVFLIVLAMIFTQFNWTQIISALQTVPKDASMINPYHNSGVESFNIFYFFIIAFTTIYTTRAWQGSQGFNAAAKNAHEAKMAGILGGWRELIQVLLIMMLPICAFTLLHHSDFSGKAQIVQRLLGAFDNDTLRKQLTVPLALTMIFPVGILGLFCAVMIGGTLATDNTYMHSWGVIFIQDVILPLRKTPLSPKAHMLLLRFSILLVAAFVFVFSLLFTQNDFILNYFNITGAIYLSGAGCAIIGGLYWKRSCPLGGWGAMITGAVVACVGFVIRAMWPATICPALMARFPDSQFLIKHSHEFPLDGTRIGFLSALSAIFVYVVFCLWNWLVLRKPAFNMEQLLHRGKYAIKGEHEEDVVLPPTGLKTVLPTKEFTRGDKIIYYVMSGWTLVGIGFLFFTTLYHFIWGTTDSWWVKYWTAKVLLVAIVGSITIIWYSIGGIRDLKYFFKTLRGAKQNVLDDGRVSGHRSVADEAIAETPQKP